MEVSVAGEMDREKLKEFRGQLRRRCIKSDVEKWEMLVRGKTTRVNNKME